MADRSGEKEFNRILRRTVILPLLLSIVIAVLLTAQIERQFSASRRVDRSDEVISQAERVQKLVLDVETGVRGYLLTGNAGFLQPYEYSLNFMLPAMDSLRGLTGAEPLQRDRAVELSVLLVRWRATARSMVLRESNGLHLTGYSALSESKLVVDRIREMLGQMIDRENATRDLRSAKAREEIQASVALTLAGVLVAGVFLSYFEGRQLVALSGSYRSALKGEQSQREALQESQKMLRAAHDELERRVEERTIALSAANRELESFSYAVSHDLRGPLRAIDGFGQALLEDCADKLDSQGRLYLDRIRGNTRRMGSLIDDLLNLSRLTRVQMRREEVDLSAISSRVIEELRALEPGRKAKVRIEPGLKAFGDPGLLAVVMQNLIGNAWKFTSRVGEASIEVGSRGGGVYFVRDNGAGFDMAYADKLFGAFQRLHGAGEFRGTGIGLATVRRVIHRHGGRIWADAKPGKGATFFFTLLPDAAERASTASEGQAA